MIIKFNGKYKSLNTFASEELIDFSVITGKNGSGKSQLIFAINQSYNQQNNGEKGFQVNFEPTIKSVHISDLIYKNSPVSYASLKQRLDPYIQQFSSLDFGLKDFFGLLVDNEISISDLTAMGLDKINELISPKKSAEYFLSILSQPGFSGLNGLTDIEIFERIKKRIQKSTDLIDILILIKNYKNKPFSLTEANDFYTVPLPEKYLDAKGLFESQIETVFYAYLKRRHDNDVLHYRKERYNQVNNSIDDIAFEKKYPAPWKIINKILTENSVGIQVQEYSLEDYSEQMTAEIKLLKMDINEPVGFNDLSSGEQIIMGLIIKLFTKNYYQGDLSFPDLIVLDEPDAFLHPEMSQLLINVLYKSFVQDMGIKVIMTTHSPSTIALTPQDSIYELKNHPHCSLKKVSKDEALNTLTGLIPTLSIDYKNHKQVFVESPTDVFYFQNIFNKLNSESRLNYKLYFISNEMGKSNCDWVIEIVKKLRDSGATKSYGIIDWDTKYTSSPEVLVHGEGKRYSIENFIYDPVYLAILFLEAKGAHGIRTHLGVDETYIPYDLIKEGEEKLQKVWDWYVDAVGGLIKGQRKDERVIVEYYDQRQVAAPSWYLAMRGHDLEEKLRLAFQFFEKYRGEGKLQQELITIMARCFPFVPLDSVQTIKQLST